MKHSLPKEAKDVVKNYLNIRVGKLLIPCPYYKNSKRFVFKNADSGKGSPTEIEHKINQITNKLGRLSKEDVLKIMANNDIGIDCSGLAINILDTILRKKNTNIKNVIKPLKKDFISLVRFWLRPYMNLSANTITSKINCVEIQIKNTLPRDLIRAGNRHLGIVTEVSLNNDGNMIIKYIHSSVDSGVVEGKIIINDVNKPLENQVWKEDPNQKSLLHEYLDSDKDDRGIRRIKFFIDLF